MKSVKFKDELINEFRVGDCWRVKYFKTSAIANYINKHKKDSLSINFYFKEMWSEVNPQSKRKLIESKLLNLQKFIDLDLYSNFDYTYMI